MSFKYNIEDDALLSVEAQQNESEVRPRYSKKHVLAMLVVLILAIVVISMTVQCQQKENRVLSRVRRVGGTRSKPSCSEYEPPSKKKRGPYEWNLVKCHIDTYVQQLMLQYETGCKVTKCTHAPTDVIKGSCIGPSVKGPLISKDGNPAIDETRFNELYDTIYQAVFKDRFEEDQQQRLATRLTVEENPTSDRLEEIKEEIANKIKSEQQKKLLDYIRQVLAGKAKYVESRFNWKNAAFKEEYAKFIKTLCKWSLEYDHMRSLGDSSLKSHWDVRPNFKDFAKKAGPLVVKNEGDSTPTLATIHYQLHNNDDFITLEKQILQSDDNCKQITEQPKLSELWSKMRIRVYQMERSCSPDNTNNMDVDIIEEACSSNDNRNAEELRVLNRNTQSLLTQLTSAKSISELTTRQCNEVGCGHESCSKAIEEGQKMFRNLQAPITGGYSNAMVKASIIYNDVLYDIELGIPIHSTYHGKLQEEDIVSLQYGHQIRPFVFVEEISRFRHSTPKPNYIGVLGNQFFSRYIDNNNGDKLSADEDNELRRRFVFIIDDRQSPKFAFISVEEEDEEQFKATLYDPYLNVQYMTESQVEDNRLEQTRDFYLKVFPGCQFTTKYENIYQPTPQECDYGIALCFIAVRLLEPYAVSINEEERTLLNNQQQVNSFRDQLAAHHFYDNPEDIPVFVFGNVAGAPDADINKKVRAETAAEALAITNAIDEVQMEIDPTEPIESIIADDFSTAVDNRDASQISLASLAICNPPNEAQVFSLDEQFIRSISHPTHESRVLDSLVDFLLIGNIEWWFNRSIAHATPENFKECGMTQQMVEDWNSPSSKLSDLHRTMPNKAEDGHYKVTEQIRKSNTQHSLHHWTYVSLLVQKLMDVQLRHVLPGIEEFQQQIQTTFLNTDNVCRSVFSNFIRCLTRRPPTSNSEAGKKITAETKKQQEKHSKVAFTTPNQSPETRVLVDALDALFTLIDYFNAVKDNDNVDFKWAADKAKNVGRHISWTQYNSASTLHSIQLALGIGTGRFKNLLRRDLTHIKVGLAADLRTGLDYKQIFGADKAVVNYNTIDRCIKTGQLDSFLIGFFTYTNEEGKKELYNILSPFRITVNTALEVNANKFTFLNSKGEKINKIVAVLIYEGRGRAILDYRQIALRIEDTDGPIIALSGAGQKLRNLAKTISVKYNARIVLCTDGDIPGLQTIRRLTDHYSKGFTVNEDADVPFQITEPDALPEDEKSNDVPDTSNEDFDPKKFSVAFLWPSLVLYKWYDVFFPPLRQEFCQRWNREILTKPENTLSNLMNNFQQNKLGTWQPGKNPLDVKPNGPTPVFHDWQKSYFDGFLSGIAKIRIILQRDDVQIKNRLTEEQRNFYKRIQFEYCVALTECTFMHSYDLPITLRTTLVIEAIHGRNYWNYELPNVPQCKSYLQP